VIAFLAAAVLALGQPRTILFVGNSFTFGADSDAMTYRKDSVRDLNGDGMGGVPALFKLFAEEAGLHYEVSLETAAGQTLKWHLANKRGAIDRAWDAVVLQEYSTLSPEKPGDITDTIQPARRMSALLRQRNPHVDISFVATWTRPDLTYPPGKHWSGSPIQRMARDLREAGDQLRAAVPSIARVIPVGQAFNCAIARGIADPNPYDGLTRGQIDLWASDHYHASNEGYYLEALTIFAALTHFDTRKLARTEQAARDLRIPPGVAAQLQQIAFDLSHGTCSAQIRPVRQSSVRAAARDAGTSIMKPVSSLEVRQNPSPSISSRSRTIRDASRAGARARRGEELWTSGSDRDTFAIETFPGEG